MKLQPLLIATAAIIAGCSKSHPDKTIDASILFVNQTSQAIHVIDKESGIKTTLNPFSGKPIIISRKECSLQAKETLSVFINNSECKLPEKWAKVMLNSQKKSAVSIGGVFIVREPEAGLEFKIVDTKPSETEG